MFRAIQIQTRTNCNRRCKFCANAYVERGKAQYIDDQVYKDIVRQLGDMSFEGRISPYLMNEPLLDRNLEDRIARAKEDCPGAHIRINTNGDFLSLKRLKSLFASGLDGLIVDCYDSKDQYDEMLLMASIGLANSEIFLQPQFDIRILPMKKKYVRICDCSDYNKNSSYLTNMAGLVKRDIGIKLPLDRSCFTIFEQMYVNYKGDAILCCQDWRHEVVLGNVVRDGILNVWNGDVVNLYRKKLSDKERGGLRLCSKCDAVSEADDSEFENDLNYTGIY